MRQAATMLQPRIKTGRNDDAGSENERRQCNERRLVKLGVPIDLNERRVNIERRLFNLDTRCFSSWLGGERDVIPGGCPHPEPLVALSRPVGGSARQRPD